MKRIMIIGCPGSGKSTFAGALQKIVQLPLIHLDMLNWNADGTTVPREIFQQRLQAELQKDCWIIDGNYGSTMEERLQQCDTVFFLDYPKDICLKGIQERKGKPRNDMPWVESSETDDTEFLAFVENYTHTSRPAVLQLLQKYSSREIHIFRERCEADQYLACMQKENKIMKEALTSTNAPKAVGPYSQAVRTESTVYVSGQLPINPSTGTAPDGIAAQTEQSIANLINVLKEDGLTLDDVVKTTVLLNDIADFKAMNEVYAAHFTAPYPARSAFQVSALPTGALVEIEAIAVRR